MKNACEMLHYGSNSICFVSLRRIAMAFNTVTKDWSMSFPYLDLNFYSIFRIACSDIMCIHSYDIVMLVRGKPFQHDTSGLAAPVVLYTLV